MRGKAGRFSRELLNPASFSGLTGWWDASDASTLFDATSGGSLVLADGGVARMQDKSGNGRQFIQSSSGSRPARKTAVQNGLDVLRFDGSNDSLSASGFVFSDIQPAATSTIFIAAKATAVTKSISDANNETLLSESSGAHGHFTVSSNNTISAWNFDGNARRVSASYTAGSWIVFSAWHTGSSLLAQINDGSSASDTLNTKTFVGSAPALGRNWNSTAFFNGDLGELATYDVALSDEARDSVISYLINKWAI